MRVARRLALGAIVALALVGVVPAQASVPTTWTTPVALDGPTELGMLPEVAMNAHGDSLAVWFAQTGAPQSILRSATRPSGGQWSAPIDRTERVEIDGTASLAMDATGQAIVAWAQWTGAHFNAFAAVVGADGDWSSPVALGDPTEPSSGPQVAVDATGHAVVAWFEGGGIKTSTFQFGGSWSTVDTIPVAGPFDFHLSTNPDGDTTIVWSLRIDRRVQTVNRTSGGSWSAPIDLSDPAIAADAPDVAVGPGTRQWRHGPRPTAAPTSQ